MKIQLSYGNLHGPIHTPETGQFGPVLQAVGDTARKGTPMELDTDTSIVTVTVPLAQGKGKGNKILFIPLTGFTHTVKAEDKANEANRKA